MPGLVTLPPRRSEQLLRHREHQLGPHSPYHIVRPSSPMAGHLLLFSEDGTILGLFSAASNPNYFSGCMIYFVVDDEQILSGPCRND